MAKKYDVIVIGSGIGGICCAALLSHAGYKTLVLERLDTLGGRASSYMKDGCIVDTFIHLLGKCEKGPIGDILRKIGKPDAIKYWHMDRDNKPALFMAGELYVYPDPTVATEEEIRTAYKGMGLSDKDYEDMRALDRLIYRMSEEESHAIDDMPYIEWLAKYTDNEKVLAMHRSRCLMAGGMGLDEASAGEMVRMTQSWHVEGHTGYPYGGFGAIAQILADIVMEYGGDVRLRETVNEILVENGAAAGVRLKNGEEINSHAVVSNAGVKSTVGRLVPKEALPDDYRRYVSNLKYGKFNEAFTTSQLSIHMLLDEQVVKHSVVFCVPVSGCRDDQKLDAISFKSPTQKEKKRLLSQIDVYMTVTSNMDPSIVPPGKQLLNFSATSFLGLSLEETIENWKSILDLLYPGLKEKILWVDVIKGSAMKHFCGHPVPNVIGMSQLVGQVGKNRPSVECPLPGLFHAGADVGRKHVGVELAADGALRATEAVLNYFASPLLSD